MSTTLEPDVPSPTDASPPAAPPAAPPHEATTPDQDLVEKSIEHPRGGQERLVPLGVVKEERKAKQALKSQLDSLQQQLAERDRNLQQLQQQWKLVEPHLPLLAEAVRAKQQGGAFAPGTPAADPDLVEFAQELGTDDLATAQRLMKAVAKLTEKQTKRLVEPVARNVAQVRASEMRERAYNAVDPKTQRPIASKQAIDTVFGALEKEMPELAENPNVANVMLLIARGLDKPSEPTLSESAGSGRGPARGADWTSLSERAAKVMGVSVDKFRQARASDSLVLED